MQRTSDRILRSVLMLLVVASGGCAREEPGVEIPLDTIWGYGMPGTQDIRDLEPDHFGPAVQKLSGQERGELYFSSLTRQISQAINRRSDEGQPICPGFAVAGTGREALVAVKEVLEQDQTPPQTFPAGTEVSLFFFTWGMEVSFGLKEVRQSEEAVTIQYQFIPSKSPGISSMRLSRHYALIPLGKLPAGNYVANIVRSTIEEKKYLKWKKKYPKWKRYQPVSKEFAEKVICKSFVFMVEPTAAKFRSDG